MPTISMFYGILVAKLFEDNDRHNLPHIHVWYAGDKASISTAIGGHNERVASRCGQG